MVILIDIYIFFLDLFGLCVNVGDVEVCCYSNTQTEIAKREIELIDASMTTVSFNFHVLYHWLSC